MAQEIFAKPCVGAIIARVINGERCILLQTRQKEDGGETNGMIELPAGKLESTRIFFLLYAEKFGKKQG